MEDVDFRRMDRGEPKIFWLGDHAFVIDTTNAIIRLENIYTRTIMVGFIYICTMFVDDVCIFCFIMKQTRSNEWFMLSDVCGESEKLPTVLTM